MTSVTQNVGHQWQTGQTTVSFAMTSTTGAIVLELALRSNNLPFATTGWSITDNVGGNTYVMRNILTGESGGRVACIIDCLNAKSGITQITVEPNFNEGLGTSGFAGCGAAQEVQGIQQFDQSGTATWSSSPIAITAGGADNGAIDFVAACMSVGNNVSSMGIYDPPSGYTSAAVNQNDSGTSGSGECCYRINASSVTDSVSWTTSGGGTSGDPAVLVSYQPPIQNSGAIAWAY